jgi:hypothetical protein
LLLPAARQNRRPAARRLLFSTLTIAVGHALSIAGARAIGINLDF